MDGMDLIRERQEAYEEAHPGIGYPGVISTGAAQGCDTSPLRTRNQELEEMFTYHNNPGAEPHYIEIREAAKNFAKLIERHAPSCADRTTAIQKLREAVMWANAAIALNGLV